MRVTPPHRRGSSCNNAATRYFVLYVGWTFDFIPVVWILRRIMRNAGQTAPPQSLHATTPQNGGKSPLRRSLSGPDWFDDVQRT